MWTPLPPLPRLSLIHILLDTGYMWELYAPDGTFLEKSLPVGERETLCQLCGDFCTFDVFLPLEEVWVELPAESLELDSFGRSVRCTSRYRNRSRWLVSFMLPSRT